MPELPEVETVCRGLRAVFEGAHIKEVVVRRRKLRQPVPKDFEHKVEGKRIISIKRRAKYILFSLNSGDTIICHLGMSGRMLIKDSKPVEPASHDHLYFVFDNKKWLVFNDARRFGLVTLAKTEALAEHALFVHLGAEPLEKIFSPRYLAARLSQRSGPIKTVLMDQTLVVGVGNIYASEALFTAGIHPLKRAREVAPQAKSLIRSIRKVLKSSIASGGSTLRDYVQSDGELGYFQHRFFVYGRAGQPCRRCRTKIKHHVTAGRSTYFCPSCQR